MITPKEKEKLEVDLPKKYAKIIEQRLIDNDVTRVDGEFYSANEISRVLRGIIKDNIIVEKHLFQLASEHRLEKVQRELARKRLMQA